MAPVLLAAAAPGMLVILAALAVSFVGNGPYDDPSFPPPPDLPFVDRASWWLSTVPGALSSVATLAALAAFALVALSRRLDRPVPSRLRLAAFCTTVLFSLMELAGPISVAVGYVLLSRDPTAASSYRPQWLSDRSSLAVCLVLAVLAGVLAWTLWTGRRSVHEEPLPDQPPARGAAQPWLDEVARETRSTHDPDAMFRRPPARHLPKTAQDGGGVADTFPRSGRSATHADGQPR